MLKNVPQKIFAEELKRIEFDVLGKFILSKKSVFPKNSEKKSENVFFDKESEDFVSIVSIRNTNVLNSIKNIHVQS